MQEIEECQTEPSIENEIQKIQAMNSGVEMREKNAEEKTDVKVPNHPGRESKKKTKMSSGRDSSKGPSFTRTVSGVFSGKLKLKRLSISTPSSPVLEMGAETPSDPASHQEKHDHLLKKPPKTPQQGQEKDGEYRRRASYWGIFKRPGKNSRVGTFDRF